MDKKQWKNKIKRECKKAGTYQPFFDSVIDTLSGIMEMRDAAEEQYRKSGGSPVVMHTNKAGATNIVKNPALAVIMDCNTQALAYWRELGLTSKSFKQMTGELAPKEEEGSFEQFLSGLGI